jgi:hypothetical protein
MIDSLSALESRLPLNSKFQPPPKKSDGNFADMIRPSTSIASVVQQTANQTFRQMNPPSQIQQSLARQSLLSKPEQTQDLFASIETRFDQQRGRRGVSSTVPESQFNSSSKGSLFQKENRLFKNEFEDPLRESKAEFGLGGLSVGSNQTRQVSRRREESMTANQERANSDGFNLKTKDNDFKNQNFENKSKRSDLEINAKGQLEGRVCVASSNFNSVSPMEGLASKPRPDSVPLCTEDKREAEVLRQQSAIKDRRIAQLESELDALKHSAEKAQEHYAALEKSLRVQFEHELTLKDQGHQREVQFLSKSNEQLVAHFKDQIEKLQALLFRKENDGQVVQEALLKVERQFQLSADALRSNETTSSNGRNQSEGNSVFDHQVGELKRVIEGLKRDTGQRSKGLVELKEKLEGQQEELTRRELELTSREVQFEEKVELTKRKFEMERERLSYETLRNAQLEKESKQRQMNLKCQEDFVTESRRQLAKEQEEHRMLLSEKTAECERLRVELLRREEELGRRTREVNDFVSSWNDRVTQVKLQEQTVQHETHNVNCQKRLLEEKEKILVDLQTKLERERYEVEEAKSHTQLMTVKNRIAELTNQTGKSCIGAALQSTYRMKAFKESRENAELKEVCLQKADNRESLNQQKLSKTLFDFSKTASSLNNRTQKQLFNSESTPPTFDLGQFIQKMNRL